MDGCVAASLMQLVPSWEQVKDAVSVLGSIVVAASLLTSLTPTPAPGTRLARVYRYLEFAALAFGRAKDTGVLPAIPKLDRSLADAIALARGKPPPTP